MKEESEFLPSALSAEKRELLAKLLREEGIEQRNAGAIPRRTSNDELPLSLAQQRLWLLEQLAPGSSVYNVPVALRLSGALNVVALEQALNEIVLRHEALRTTFSTVESTAIQIVAEKIVLKLEVSDCSEAYAIKLATEEAQQPFDLTQGPLIRCRLLKLSANEHVLLITMHHIVSDGWSLGVFKRELGSLYNSFSGNAPSTLPELQIQYGDFAIWERRRLSGEALTEQISYWQNKLEHAAQTLELPTDRPRPAAHSYNGSRHPLRIAATTTSSLKRLSREEDCSLFMILLAAYNVLLYRYSLQTDILVGTPVANRIRPQVEGLIGLFVNTLVLRTDLSGTPSFRDVMLRVREVCLEAYAHQEVPFERIVEQVAGERTLNRTPLFQVMFALENTPREDLKLKDLEISPFAVPRSTTKFDLTLSLFENEGELQGALQYNTDLFDSTTVERIVQNFEVLINGVVADPDQRIDLLPLLSAGERHRLLSEWNDTRREYPRDVVYRMFEQQVERTPDAAALVFEQDHLSYRQLNERANQLARYLRETGVGPDSMVGLCFEKSIDMMVAMLGILKAGGAYVPIDPAYPLQRIAFMVEDAGIDVVVSKEEIAKELRPFVTRVVCLDSDATVIGRQSIENLVDGAAPENAIYVIYTSGSTGKPKGVVIEHRQLSNYVHAVSERLGLTAASFAMVQPLTVDSSQTVIFPVLCVGGCLHLISTELASDADRLSDYFLQHKIECLKIAPSHLAALHTSANEHAIMPGRWLVIGGEAPRREWVEGLQRLGPECVVVNHYGPTEATVGMLTCQFSEDIRRSTSGHFQIGRPLGNTEAYILDARLQPVPIGVTGELFIGGDCLARGYLRHPDLTAERFIANPFSSEPGTRLYRTGDLVRYLADGAVEFLGRMDHQVKVRGFRIELNEIEQKLAEHDAVRESLVMLREEESGQRQLVAYVVLKPEFKATIGDLRRHLKDALPDYLVPTAFVLLDEFPRTPHGKLDRLALPKPSGRSEINEEYVAPRTATESAMAEIWHQVLGVDRIGIHDNFFEVGGHSLLAMQIISRVRKTFQVELPLRVIFEKPTIEGLSAVVERSQGEVSINPIKKAGSQRREELLAMLDLLSIEETDALLKEHNSLEEENLR